jgi:aryl-alcohol dehydrogenase-like predicted oxidoreductase
MRMRPLGTTGLDVSELSIGTWAFGGDEWGAADDAGAIATIRAAIDAGVTLIDTADVYGYGHSEELVADALATSSSDVLVCSKAGNDIYETPREAGGGPKRFSAEYLARAIDGSLRRLRRAAVDIYLLHNPSLDVLGADEAMGALRDARDAGRVRFVGASVYTAAEGRAAIEIGGADVVMIPHSLLNHGESGELLALADELGCAVMARSVLANGLLTGKYDARSTFGADDHRSHRGAEWLSSALAKIDAIRPVAERHDLALRDLSLAYALSDPRLASVVIGARSQSQLADNLAAAALAPLEDAVLADLARIEEGGGR